MTVAELIDMLEQLPQDAEIRDGYSGNDPNPRFFEDMHGDGTDVVLL